MNVGEQLTDGVTRFLFFHVLIDDSPDDLRLVCELEGHTDGIDISTWGTGYRTLLCGRCGEMVRQGFGRMKFDVARKDSVIIFERVDDITQASDVALLVHMETHPWVTAWLRTRDIRAIVDDQTWDQIMDKMDGEAGE